MTGAEEKVIRAAVKLRAVLDRPDAVIEQCLTLEAFCLAVDLMIAEACERVLDDVARHEEHNVERRPSGGWRAT